MIFWIMPSFVSFVNFSISQFTNGFTLFNFFILQSLITVFYTIFIQKNFDSRFVHSKTKLSEHEKKGNQEYRKSIYTQPTAL